MQQNIMTDKGGGGWGEQISDIYDKGGGGWPISDFGCKVKSLSIYIYTWFCFSTSVRDIFPHSAFCGLLT